MEKRELPCTVGGNVNLYSHYGGFLKLPLHPSCSPDTHVPSSNEGLPSKQGCSLGAGLLFQPGAALEGWEGPCPAQIRANSVQCRHSGPGEWVLKGSDSALISFTPSHFLLRI